MPANKTAMEATRSSKPGWEAAFRTGSGAEASLQFLLQDQPLADDFSGSKCAKGALFEWLPDIRATTSKLPRVLHLEG
ncbi:hypothetical protein [Pseudoxanthomonas wuyuanensis]|uniref:hypothetical protein n=1 Tax=Pseudoxanthomonas wuyuanensis TaxID=1073196 RepID=UPI0011416103|nr:hypothetical protein [Pseudoxanthomonas wuyuanensis]